MITGQDIVYAAYKLKGARYRAWSLGSPIPMWTWDGQGNPPPADYLVDGPGVMCSDLVSFAAMRNGLPPVYGTENLAYHLINQQPFDPSTPGEPGAICLRPYSGPALKDQGHVAIYVDEHTIIQVLWTDGVTDAYTDAESWAWGGAAEFTVYGFLPGVTYGIDASARPGGKAPQWLAVDALGTLAADGSDYSRGWYDTGYKNGDWAFYPGKA